MGHRNARLTVHGRRLLVERVVIDGRPCSHVAKELGISRQRAGVWVMRYLSEGEAGLHDRSSRPHTSPTRTTGEIEAQRRYHLTPQTAGTIAALLTLREHVIGPILAGVRSPRMGRKPITWTSVDRDYEKIRIDMQTLFQHLGIQAAA